jgi:hypothetical protein
VFDDEGEHEVKIILITHSSNFKYFFKIVAVKDVYLIRAFQTSIIAETNQSISVPMLATITNNETWTVVFSCRHLKFQSALSPTGRKHNVCDIQTFNTLLYFNMPGNYSCSIAFANRRRMYDLGHLTLKICTKIESLSIEMNTILQPIHPF